MRVCLQSRLKLPHLGSWGKNIPRLHSLGTPPPSAMEVRPEDTKLPLSPCLPDTSLEKLRELPSTSTTSTNLTTSSFLDLAAQTMDASTCLTRGKEKLNAYTRRTMPATAVLHCLGPLHADRSAAYLTALSFLRSRSTPAGRPDW